MCSVRIQLFLIVNNYTAQIKTVLVAGLGLTFMYLGQIRYQPIYFLEDLRREGGGRRIKTKRIRTIFTPEQLEFLEEEFRK